MLLCVFSKPLHLSDTVYWMLAATMFVFLYLEFRYIKQMKAERAAKVLTENEKNDAAKKMKKSTFWIILYGVAMSLLTPLWLPFTGESLGVRGDTVIGITSGVIFFTVFVTVRRKRHGQASEPPTSNC
jgi:hypothetical protein